MCIRDRTMEVLKTFLREHTSLSVTDRGGWFYALHQENGAEETVVFRADMDAIKGPGNIPYHGCGHDGHSAILAGLCLLTEGRVFQKNLCFLFQPAEETGEGGNPCSRLLEELGADRVYGFHNLPGYPLGTAVMRRETFSCDTVNTPEITDMSRMLFEQEGIPCLEAAAPFRWSEDFGWYLKKCRGMYFGIGAGEDCPDLHTPDYEFPDEVIRNAVRCLYLLAEI